MMPETLQNKVVMEEMSEVKVVMIMSVQKVASGVDDDAGAKGGGDGVAVVHGGENSALPHECACFD